MGRGPCEGCLGSQGPRRPSLPALFWPPVAIERPAVTERLVPLCACVAAFPHSSATDRVVAATERLVPLCACVAAFRHSSATDQVVAVTELWGGPSHLLASGILRPIAFFGSDTDQVVSLAPHSGILRLLIKKCPSHILAAGSIPTKRDPSQESHCGAGAFGAGAFGLGMYALFACVLSVPLCSLCSL